MAQLTRNQKLNASILTVLMVLGLAWGLTLAWQQRALESSHSEPTGILVAVPPEDDELWPDVCGLDVVVCDGEARARITAYEAVEEQTDDTPCHDGRLNICKMYRAGINTCATHRYERGTVLWINGLGTCTVSGVTAPEHADSIDWFCGERPSSSDCVLSVQLIDEATVVPIS